VPTTGEGWLRWLRKANEIQCIIPYVTLIPYINSMLPPMLTHQIVGCSPYSDLLRPTTDMVLDLINLNKSCFASVTLNTFFLLFI